MSKQFSALTVVVEFGARQVDAVVLSIEMLVGSSETKVATLPSGQEMDLNYLESDFNLAQASAALASGELASILVEPVEKGGGFHAMVFCPDFCGDGFKWWHGAVELETGYEPDLTDRVRKIPALEFVSISIEDGLDLSDRDRITEEAFPWDDWRLVEAVVANGEPLSQKEVRRGPAAAKVLAS